MLQNIANKKHSSLQATWVYIVAGIFITTVVLYLFFLTGDSIKTSLWAGRNGILIRIVFWSLAGALAHLLVVGLQNVKKRHGQFYLQDVFLQALQILLAPLIAIFLFSVLYSNFQTVPFDDGYIILSFVSGLLTIQLFLFLKKREATEGTNYESFGEFTLAENVALTPEEPQEPKTEWQEENYGFTATSDIFITLELNPAGLFEDVKKELRQKGFAATSVSIQKDGHEDIINAKKIREDLFPVYHLEELEQGTYTIRAMLSLRMKDNSIVNLFGEQKVALTGEDKEIKLPLQKLKS